MKPTDYIEWDNLKDIPFFLCQVVEDREKQDLDIYSSIQSIPVYGFLFHPTKITSWGKNVQEYGVKTIKSVENKYL